MALARCEIQAIDQHWSLHRLALSLSDGWPDHGLAVALDFAPVVSGVHDIVWPAPDPGRWHELLSAALLQELTDDLGPIRLRQENYLRRELDRIENYFDEYERELAARATRTANESLRMKSTSRLEAAQAERARRRADQVDRHQIHVRPSLDALLLVAEPAWEGKVSFVSGHDNRTRAARFIPRARRWAIESA